MPRKILLLMAHPAIHRSSVNRSLFKLASQLDHVTAIDLYAEYPDHHIDIDVEQQRLRDHDVVIFQFPMYWYSTPAILKEWQDLVLEYGFAYGSEGKALHDKLFICATSAGGSEDTYCATGYNHFSIRALLQPLEQMASLTGMRYLPPFVLFDSRRAADGEALKTHQQRWRELLTHLQQREVDWSFADQAKRSENCLDQLFMQGETP